MERICMIKELKYINLYHCSLMKWVKHGSESGFRITARTQSAKKHVYQTEIVTVKVVTLSL